jgi:hypothetical protein
MTVDRAGEILINGAAEALVSAFLVWLLGGVALNIAGGFAQGMIPSPPPFLHSPIQLEADPASANHVWWRVLRGYSFGFLYGVCFLHSIWVGFRGFRASPGDGGIERRLRSIFSNLREHWFRLIVGNAIGAWVGAMVLSWVQQFSLSQQLWRWLLESLGHELFGSSHRGPLGDLISWYGANQVKLNFWFLYLAGMLDDIGVPNYKTMARWAWRRWTGRSRGCKSRSGPTVATLACQQHDDSEAGHREGGGFGN